MTREDLELKARRICEEALRRSIPSEEEKRRTLEFTEELAGRLEKELERAGFEAEVQVEGSIAKDTWLAGEKDIDLFTLIPKTYGREAFDVVLEVARKVAGENALEAYAEHPYIQAKIDGFIVDFVPSFKLEKAEEAVSSVDRTPFHTLYVKERLTPEAKSEVRLLKRFMRGIGTYGAEIKVGGFSGYLCEVLTLYYGGFLKLIKAACDWSEGVLADLEGHYRGREKKAREIFQEPLIVIDPVDKGRNVASAVGIGKLSEFIAASREFLTDPSLSFFYPSDAEAYSLEELSGAMRSRGSALVFLKTGVVRAVPDVLWGQLYKSQRALRNLIRRHKFTVIRDDVWSDEEVATVFLFELHSRSLPAVEKHLGPPVRKKDDCERFLEKHLGSEQSMSGPRIEGDRWVVERKRKYTDIADLLGQELRDRRGNAGIASLVSEALSSSFSVLINAEIAEFYSENPGFASFLTRYLGGKPGWLG